MFVPLCTGDHSLPLLTTGVTSTGEKGLGDEGSQGLGEGRFWRVGEGALRFIVIQDTHA